MFYGTEEAERVSSRLLRVLEKHPITKDNVSEWTIFINYVEMTIEEIGEKVYEINTEQRRARNGKR